MAEQVLHEGRVAVGLGVKGLGQLPRVIAELGAYCLGRELGQLGDRQSRQGVLLDAGQAPNIGHRRGQGVAVAKLGFA